MRLFLFHSTATILKLLLYLVVQRAELLWHTLKIAPLEPNWSMLSTEICATTAMHFTLQHCHDHMHMTCQGTAAVQLQPVTQLALYARHVHDYRLTWRRLIKPKHVVEFRNLSYNLVDYFFSNTTVWVAGKHFAYNTSWCSAAHLQAAHTVTVTTQQAKAIPVTCAGAAKWAVWNDSTHCSCA